MFDVFISSPYRSDSVEGMNFNVRAVENYAVQLMVEKRFTVFSPVVYANTLTRDYELPDDYEYWQKLCESTIKMSKDFHVLCTPGWERSEGVGKEMDYARLNGKTAKFITVQYLGEGHWVFTSNDE